MAARAPDRHADLPPFDAGLRLVDPGVAGERSATTGSLSDAQLRLLALEGVVTTRAGDRGVERGRGGLLDDLHAADPDSLEDDRYLATGGPEGV